MQLGFENIYKTDELLAKIMNQDTKEESGVTRHWQLDSMNIKKNTEVYFSSVILTYHIKISKWV